VTVRGNGPLPGKRGYRKSPIKAVDRACAAVTGARNLSRVLNIRKI